MIVYPNAKINLGLWITEKRNDGFHEIESVFLPVKWCDALEFLPCQEETLFSSSGIAIPSEGKDNLIVQAYTLLKRDFELPSLNIHLHKKIPIGAGLGGGSADCAFMLSALNNEFNLNLSNLQLEKYALQLGSDCPFFIENKPKFVTGRGEEMGTIHLPQDPVYIVLINPGIHISTKEAYSGVIPRKRRQSLKDLIEDTVIENWQKSIVNDFEDSLFLKYPLLDQLKNELIDQGAFYASMSGSGSTVYGLFKNKVNFKSLICQGELYHGQLW